MANSNRSILVEDIGKDGIQNRVRSFLDAMFSSDLVDAVLVPQPTPDGSGYVQSFVTDTEKLKSAVPFAPTMAIHSSHILADITSELQGRIAAVLKPIDASIWQELNEEFGL